jgi:hypothetical protein
MKSQARDDAGLKNIGFLVSSSIPKFVRRLPQAHVNFGIGTLEVTKQRGGDD